MTLALVAFARLYYVTHREPEGRAVPVPPRGVPSAPSPAAPSCPTLEKTLEGVLKAPEDATALASARRELEACPTPPIRVCELGPALDARFPLKAGEAPAHELLDVLCQRCPSGANPCEQAVVRAVRAASQRGTPPPALPLWHLEHAGPGTQGACAEVVRTLLAPAALDEDPLTQERKTWLEQLTPVCAREGQVSSPLLRAVVAQGDVPALASLVQTAMPTTTTNVLKPDRIVGPEGAERAFDGQESTSVTLTVAEQAPRWRKDGALSAVFEPPAQALTALRVRARGPGLLRAMVRVREEVGLHDPDTRTNFVRPRVCQFQGTGQWESCALPTALLDVEAISVFPAKRSLSLIDVEASVTR
ncbi:hypothetical protein BON30_42905 [Cystobacter ferrugineus]|uniref:Uncharacterized protein n=2 Tax=Cystobacter ferrugineus TaxID=83449 RepID=A0A1L9AX32_9BACT|nr:hypothetical protein BON30_42905 [Cystobacter ferrugineus]